MTSGRINSIRMYRKLPLLSFNDAGNGLTTLPLCQHAIREDVANYTGRGPLKSTEIAFIAVRVSNEFRTDVDPELKRFCRCFTEIVICRMGGGEGVVN